ncbi:permease prefix domain 1-containing protein [Nonomuraea sp. NPDC050404]|uniref:permease prefix domain 1-containing protein n=1 Tax=Nonomuraea sp. NPDC050404 TaxID=3155783 RepID=UPI0033E22270
MLIDDYVAKLDGALKGPRRPKRDLVVEARDSLVDTADALEADGLERAEAERRAVAEFGRISEIAPGYQTELTAVAGRRLGVLLFVSVPITVAMWSALWQLYPGTDQAWLNQPWWYSPASKLLDLIQLGVALYGGLALFALSRGARWIRRPRLVTRSLAVAVFAGLPVTFGLSMLMTFGMESPNTLEATPALLANLVTSVMWGTQIYCATRCVRITREPATTVSTW